MDASPTVTRPLVFYGWGLAVLGMVLLAASWLLMPPILTPLMLLLIASALLAEYLAVDMPGVGSTSLSYPLSMATLLLFGPAAAGVVSLLSSPDWRNLRSRRSSALLAMNAGQMVIAACAAGWAYLLCGGRVLVATTSYGWTYRPLMPADFPEILLALLVCAVVSVALNDLLVSFGIHLYLDVPWMQVLSGDVVWMASRQLTLAAVGFAIAQVLSISRPAFILFLVPLIVARQVFRHSLTLRRAYLDTIRGLVRAVEAKDPYTRGHSERVARYATALGKRLGLPAPQIESLEYAALLHDIGKIGIPTTVLTKPARLTNEEYALIQQHPRIGAQIVSKVPYLTNIVDTVLYHHEHYDGRGYGEGVLAEEIPLLARVMACADAYDAMTSERPYRRGMTPEEAADEVGRCSGTQFDPHIAELLVERIVAGDLDVLPIGANVERTHDA